MLYIMFRYIPFLFLLLAPAAAFAQQPPKVLVASGKEVAAGMLDPGMLACIGGQPSGRPLQCSQGTSRILFSYVVSQQGYQDVVGTAAAMFRGQNTIVMHCNLDANYYGHCWGHFVWDAPDAGGKWEGVWSGMWDYSANRVSYQMTGYGTGGQLEGLRFEKESAWPGGTPSGTFVVKVFAK
jgi:hypothetical protein